MAISFQSEEEVLRKLRDKLRKMTDEELIRFGKEVGRLAENPLQVSHSPRRLSWGTLHPYLSPAFSLNPLRARSRARETSSPLCRAGQSHVMKAGHTTGIPFSPRVFI